MHKFTHPRGKCPIDDYNQRSLGFLIPGSRLNTRNSLGARPYCNRQPLKNLQIERNRENLTTQNFFSRIIFSMKISQSTGTTTHYYCIRSTPYVGKDCPHLSPSPPPPIVNMFGPFLHQMKSSTWYT